VTIPVYIPLTYVYTRLRPVATEDAKVAIFADYSEGLWTPGICGYSQLAEGVGFEPTRECYPLPVFKTGALNHSATLPYQQDQSLRPYPLTTIGVNCIAWTDLGQSFLLFTNVGKQCSMTSAGLSWCSQCFVPTL
jgi:hypothetical protein